MSTPGRASSSLGMFRFAGRLPITDPARAVSLGEGDTPLVEVNAPSGCGGGCRVRVKCESFNPTGSFKDRVAALAATLAVEKDLVGWVGTSSGNGGAAMAAYAARTGKPLVLFALADTVPAKLAQIRAAGARVVLLEGLGYDGAATDRAAELIAQSAAERGWFSFITANRFAPEAMRGCSTIAYELAEQAPAASAVYVPIGGGGLYSSIWGGYAELAGESPAGRPPPRLVAVQPSGCPTVRNVLEGSGPRLACPVRTSISGLQVGALFDAALVSRALFESSGHLVEVSDEEVAAAQRSLARQGLLLEPAGAAAFAGLVADASAGRISPGEDIVVLGTGAGYKDLGALERIAGASPLLHSGTEQIAELLDELTPRGSRSVDPGA